MIKKIILLLAFPVLLFAQGKFAVDFDYAVFPADSQGGSFELYYSFYQPGMNHFKKNGKNFVAGLLNIAIKNALTDSLAFKKEYRFVAEYDSNNSPKTLTGLLRIPLTIGKYRCTVIGKDATDGTKVDSVSWEFGMRARARKRFSLSDIQLAGKIKDFETDEKSLFYKNTLEVIPNPSAVFGKDLPVLYFYNELYNINKEAKSNALKVSHYIFDASNRVRYLKNRFYPRTNENIVDFGAINISKLPSGVYTLVIAATDTLSGVSIKSSKRFFVYNPGVKDTLKPIAVSPDLLASEIATMSAAEVDKMFEESRYIARQDEINAWKKLSNLEGKKKFLYEFWKRRDSNPDTPENETKIEYFKRVAYANKSFGNMIQREGWKTDKGRVYILYGAPSEVERHPNETDSKPYEIWHYNNIEGGVIFVFADFSGFNDYRLIHSTKRGELSDINWRSRIRD